MRTFDDEFSARDRACVLILSVCPAFLCTHSPLNLSPQFPNNTNFAIEHLKQNELYKFTLWIIFYREFL